MGCFSWTCAVCGEGILAAMSGSGRGYSQFSQAVVLWPNGNRISGQYDGYGNIGSTEDIVCFSGSWKIAHQCCAEGKNYEDMGESGNDPQQGWGHGELENRKRYGEPNLDELRYTHYGCKSCMKAWTSKFSGGKCPFCGIEDDDKVEIISVEHVGVVCLGSKNSEMERECWRTGEVRNECYELDAEMEPTVEPDQCRGCGGSVEVKNYDWSEAIGVFHRDWNPTHYVDPTPKSYGFTEIPVRLQDGVVLTRDEFIEQHSKEVTPRFQHRDGTFFEGEVKISSKTVEEIRASMEA